MINHMCEMRKRNQMKKMIIAVIYAIKEIAIKPERASSNFFSGLIAISLFAYTTAMTRILFFIRRNTIVTVIINASLHSVFSMTTKGVKQ